MTFNYPLELSFKVLALAPQLAVTDVTGQLLFYVKQKLFKLKEEVTVFADREQTRPLFRINADRILDFSARYFFSDLNGIRLGSVKREGVRSLWRAHYEVQVGEAVAATIREEQPWVKMADGCLAEIPIVGLFAGYFFNPTYLVARPDGTLLMRLKKEPAFWESRFTISKEVPLAEGEELQLLLSLLMMVLLERSRG
jgi:uncharacterized protein YxjI